MPVEVKVEQRHKDEAVTLANRLNLTADQFTSGIADVFARSFAQFEARLSHSATPSVDGWSAMDSAPKDGTPILAWFWSALASSAYGWADTIRWHNGMWWDDRDGPCEPVAWRHRPNPPTIPLQPLSPRPLPTREKVGEADLFQALHDAMGDELDGKPDGDILIKGCEAAGYADPESAADAFKADAVKRILALLSREAQS